jgi:hypothetical protein
MGMRNRAGTLDLTSSGDGLVLCDLSGPSASFAVKVFKSLEPQSSPGMRQGENPHGVRDENVDSLRSQKCGKP